MVMEIKDFTKFDLSLFNSCDVLVVGDMMIDEYVWGEVSRISPEAPVQVVEVKSESSTLGGAGNVVNNLTALGARVSVAAVMGDGPAGAALSRMFKDLGVNTDCLLPEPGRSTTRKTRVIAANQQVLRIDRESRKDITDEQSRALCRYAEKRMPQCDLVIVSDYGKGVVTPRLMEGLTEICRRQKKILIVDPKGRDYSKYRGAYAITPNKKEAALASGVDILDRESLTRAGEIILNRTGAQRLLITCGKDGMALFQPESSPRLISAKARQVFDVSGAGDTVISVLGLCMAAGASFEVAAGLANTAAGIVVAKVGTATLSQAELAAELQDHPESSSEKIKTLEELVAIVGSLRKSGKKIVLTNGCFDLLHEGHIRLFQHSKRMGDFLIAAVDDDESVRKIKGDGRPVIREKERVRILSALDSVDFVTVFASHELEGLIRALRPDVLTKGGNYSRDQVAGGELVEELGGRVVIMPIEDAASSTQIIRAIREGSC